MRKPSEAKSIAIETLEWKDVERDIDWALARPWSIYEVRSVNIRQYGRKFSNTKEMIEKALLEYRGTGWICYKGVLSDLCFCSPLDEQFNKNNNFWTRFRTWLKTS